MLIILLSEEIRIRGTEHCWQLEKSRKRDGKHDWEAFKYFQSFGEAVGAAGRREIRLHPATGLVEALKAIDQIAARYSKLLDDALSEIASKEAA